VHKNGVDTAIDEDNKETKEGKEDLWNGARKWKTNKT
jgi:hypothetical protein